MVARESTIVDFVIDDRNVKVKAFCSLHFMYKRLKALNISVKDNGIPTVRKLKIPSGSFGQPYLLFK